MLKYLKLKTVRTSLDTIGSRVQDYLESSNQVYNSEAAKAARTERTMLEVESYVHELRKENLELLESLETTDFSKLDKWILEQTKKTTKKK